MLRGRGEWRATFSSAISTATLAPAVTSAAVATAPVTATLAAATLAAAALAAAVTTTVTTATSATSTVASAVAAAAIATPTLATTVATTISSANAIPGELNTHLHAAGLDLHARVRRLWSLGDVDGWMHAECHVARGLLSLPAVRRSALYTW